MRRVEPQPDLSSSPSLSSQIAELLEQTVAGCKPNKLLLSDTTKGTGFLKIKTIGELFFSSTHTSHPLPSAYLDLIAHLNPRLKEPELRTKHAEIAFKSFEGALGEKLKKLLVETPNSEWYSTRAKLLTAVAQSDVNRLQLFPLLSVHRSSTGNLDLLDNEEDRDSIETGIKFLYLDAEGMIYTVNEDGEESTRVPFKEVVKTTFKEEEAGADQTTLMTCETKNQGVFKFKLKCSRADIQRVCARRPFATPIDSPIAKYDRRRASVPVGAPLVLPDSPIAGAEGSGEEEEQEKEVFQQPPTPVEAITTTSDQAKVPPPSPRKPLSSAASSSSFVKKKIPPPHLNLDLGDHHLQKQPPSSSPASTTTVGKQPKAKPKSTSTQPPAAPSKPTSSSKIAKLSKLSPPKAPQLDSSLFGKGNESDSELSEVSTVGPSQSQSQGQVTTGWKRKRVVEASQEEEVEEEEKAGKKKPKTTTKTPRLHEEEEEDDDDLDLLNNNNDDDDDDGGGTSLAAPPTKQPVPRKTYGSSSARKKSTSISATPNSKSTSRKSLVGFMKPKSKAKANVASSRSSPFPDLPSSPNSNHIGGGKGDETDEYDDLPSIPRGAKMNPITAARREPAPRGGKGKAKGGKTTKETGKKAAGKKETIDISDSDENDDGTTTKKTSGGTALRNKSKSSNVASPRDGEAAGGRKSLRKSAVVARKRFGSAAREEEEEMQVERGKTDRKGKGKEKKEPTPDAYSYPADDDMGNNFANDTGSNVNSPSTRNDFLLSQTNSNANSQAFAYEESQAVFGGAMFKSQTSNSNASDEMDVLGNDTNDRAGDGDVRMDDDDDAEEVAPMPDPLKFVDEDINLVLSGEVGNSMPLGKKRVRVLVFGFLRTRRGVGLEGRERLG
ncbi:hypothetical protein BDY24DRAFT_287235 [Mrakia frigida]|uniref:uncharacterized protein n=1 Tax=Mrakia frigida TaxID=29902 RepID=UPI003FCC0116